jgi:hypothetical protein
MQRDMDLIRAILLKMEAHPHGYAPKLDLDGYTPEEIGFHVSIMGQAGLIKACDCTSHDDTSPSAIPVCLTWEGYEFLAAAKDESVWRKGTAAVMAKVGAIGFDVLKAFLVAEARTRLGMPPG